MFVSQNFDMFTFLGILLTIEFLLNWSNVEWQ
jgi:hypothetical protein